GAQSATDWPAVAGDVGARKYSAADQITPANVNKLSPAWTYAPGGPNPIVIHNVMYFVAGGRTVTALKADDGTELWKYSLADAAPGVSQRRGLTYWPGDSQHQPRILVTMATGTLVQLDAKTGQLVPKCGIIDLVNGIMDKFPGEAYSIAAPVAVYKNLAIFAGRTGEQNRWGIPGDPRAFDLLTGKEIW